MNDPLSDLQQYLISQGFADVYIDGFVEITPDEDVRNLNQINIQSENSSEYIELPLGRISWSIYIKNQDKELAKTQAKNIRNLLQNKPGKLIAGSSSVVFGKITCITREYFWGGSSQTSYIYMNKFSSIIKDPDIKNIYSNSF